jgi:hypothetical protein
LKSIPAAGFYGWKSPCRKACLGDAVDDVYAGIPSRLEGDLLRSQLDLLEKVEW